MLQFASLFAVYFVLWWLCLFLVLPFGVHTQSEAGEITEGTEPGAPARMRLWPKLLATTVFSGLMMAVVLWAVNLPWLQALWS
ncbi:MAG TPA: DUF1467 family protein [Devosiaceae bacterium]